MRLPLLRHRGPTAPAMILQSDAPRVREVNADLGLARGTRRSWSHHDRWLRRTPPCSCAHKHTL